VTPQQRDAAALACARRMADYCVASGHYGHYMGFTNIEEALRGIASGKAGFGDVCDDNIFIHEVLSSMKLVPRSVERSMKSDKATRTWNEVVSVLDWAAGEVLKERQSA
jgi:hypothetical protein